MFVDPPITLLALQFSHVLLTVSTFVAPSDIDGIFRAAVSLLPDGESFLARSVMKDVGVDYMGAAFSIASASAGGASSRCWFRSNDFAISQPCLSQQVAQVSVSAVADPWFFLEFAAFSGVDLEDLPVVVYDLLYSG